MIFLLSPVFGKLNSTSHVCTGMANNKDTIPYEIIFKNLSAFQKHQQQYNALRNSIVFKTSVFCLPILSIKKFYFITL